MKLKSRRPNQLMLGAAIVILVGSGSSLAYALAGSPSQPSPTTQPPPTPGPYAYLPPAKAAPFASQQAAQAAHPAATKPTSVPSYVAPTPVTHRVAGINNETRQGPFPAADFLVANFYQGPGGSNWYLVFAGTNGVYTGTNLNGTAGLRILSESPINQMTPVGSFPLPNDFGALRVTAFSGDVITVVDSHGQTRHFNLATLTYS